MRPVEDNSGLGGSAGIITDDSTQEGVSGFSTDTPKKLISSFCQNGLLKLQHFALCYCYNHTLYSIVNFCFTN